MIVYQILKRLIVEHDNIIETLAKRSLEDLIFNLTEHIKAIRLQHYDAANS